MKKSLRLVAINIAVLIAFLLVLEVALRLLGMQTINQLEMGEKNWKPKYKRFCKRILKEDLKVYDRFYTDSEGIFKAAPNDKFNKLGKKSLGKVIINSEGFRGGEFKTVNTSKAKILLLGDSFTWGLGAEPIENCFADLLQKAGYHIYNSGIGGTDPGQYARIALKYIPLLKPDVVAACLHLGNDFKNYPHPIEPNRNIRYSTNMGMILGYDERGNFFRNAKDAIDYLKKRKCGQCSNIWDKFIYKTVMGKAVLALENLTKPDYRRLYKPKKWVTDALWNIQKTCDKYDSRFLLFVIPVAKRRERKGNTIEQNSYLFKDFKSFYPGNFNSSEYCTPINSYFNNLGHKKFANFMVNVLISEDFSPK